MSAALEIARREFRADIRNRWFAAAILLMLAFALALVALGSAPAGRVGASPLAVAVVSLSTLAVYFVPLLALLLGHDAVIGEAERGTLALTMAYPVTRFAFLGGKLAAHALLLALATLIGFGGAGILAMVAGNSTSAEDWRLLGLLIVSTAGLGLVFLGLGYAVSARVRERATAVGLAIGLWLFFVILYDLAVIGLLVATGGALPHGLVEALLLLNPTDIYRLIHLGASDETRLAAGLAGAGLKLGIAPGLLAGAGAAWIALSLHTAFAAFRRREI